MHVDIEAEWMLATKGGGSSTGQVRQVSEGPHCRPFREGGIFGLVSWIGWTS